MNVIGYIRVSTDTQDLEKQRHLLLEYAQRHQLLIGEFINVEVSSRRDTKERRIDELLAKLDDGDTLIVAELSRLGRNMLETFNIINRLGEQGVRIISVRPAMARPKQGLAAARASGKKLGRPIGSRNRVRVLDPFRDQIKEYLAIGLNLASVRKIVNRQLERPVSYNAYKYFVKREPDLNHLWQRQKNASPQSA